MALTFAQCRQLNPESLALAGLDFSTAASTLNAAATDTKTGLANMTTVSWSGTVREHADAAIGDFAGTLMELATGNKKTAESIDRAVTDFGLATKLLDMAVASAQASGYEVNPVTGVVRASALILQTFGQAIADAATAVWNGLISALVKLISLLDELLALAIQTLLFPFHALPSAGRTAKTIGSPEFPPYGTVPASEINAKNRTQLDQDIAQTKEEIQGLKIRPDNQHQVAAVKQKLARLEALKQSLQQPDTYLLEYTEKTAAVSYGNPDTAQTVATFVPGTSANLQGMPGYVATAATLADAAGGPASPISGSSGQPKGGTAVVAWMGYDAPPTLVEAAGSGRATKGAQQLQQFQERLAQRGGDQRLIVVGHSYGSTVVGHAARDEGLRADEVVFVGSPGVGLNHASEVVLIDGDGRRIPPEQTPAHVHATTLPKDAIGYIGGDRFGHHGPDPAQNGFGAQVFDSQAEGWLGTADQGHPIRAHTSGYWKSPAFQDYWKSLMTGEKVPG